jgi:hypothetical protein
LVLDPGGNSWEIGVFPKNRGAGEIRNAGVACLSHAGGAIFPSKSNELHSETARWRPHLSPCATTGLPKSLQAEPTKGAQGPLGPEPGSCPFGRWGQCPQATTNGSRCRLAGPSPIPVSKR